MDRPFLPNEVSANLARDWPDARGIWYNEDKSLGLYVNRNDHMLLCVTEKATDLKNSFKKLVDFVKRVGFILKKFQIRPRYL
jgi:creatine kinase